MGQQIAPRPRARGSTLTTSMMQHAQYAAGRPPAGGGSPARDHAWPLRRCRSSAKRNRKPQGLIANCTKADVMIRRSHALIPCDERRIHGSRLKGAAHTTRPPQMTIGASRRAERTSRSPPTESLTKPPTEYN
jgi:hypothetical protein